MGVGLLSSVFCRHWLNRQAIEIWSDDQTVATWITVERVLAQVQGKLGLIPASASQAIGQLDSQCVDFGRLSGDISVHMHPFTPVLRQLEHALDGESAGYLHWGATTQNIFDTAHALQMSRTHQLIESDLRATLVQMRKLAATYQGTPQSGRTHGQHALPITFGLKVAGWHDELSRHVGRITEAARTDFSVAMGGAVGSFAAMEGRGREVQRELARELGLSHTDVPMRSSNDRMAHYVLLLGLMGNCVERIAREIVFLQRTEIAEVFEEDHDGKVGSSTMPQKRNPSHAMNLIGVAMRLRACCQVLNETMLIENEGFAAHSNVNDVTLPEAAICAASLAAGLRHLMAGIKVDAAAMKENLEITGGQIMSEAVMMLLARHLGRHRAHEILHQAVSRANESGVGLLEAIRQDPRVVDLALERQIAAMLDVSTYLGESGEIAQGLPSA